MQQYLTASDFLLATSRSSSRALASSLLTRATLSLLRTCQLKEYNVMLLVLVDRNYLAGAVEWFSLSSQSVLWLQVNEWALASQSAMTISSNWSPREYKSKVKPEVKSPCLTKHNHHHIYSNNNGPFLGVMLLAPTFVFQTKKSKSWSGAKHWSSPFYDPNWINYQNLIIIEI